MTAKDQQPIRIDIDARRREADDVPIVVVIDGHEFRIRRRQLGLRMVRAAASEDLTAMMQIVLGDDRIGDTIDLSVEEIKYIMDAVNAELGFDQPGEASASPAISLTTTMPSRPTATDISV